MDVLSNRTSDRIRDQRGVIELLSLQQAVDPMLEVYAWSRLAVGLIDGVVEPATFRVHAIDTRAWHRLASATRLSNTAGEEQAASQRLVDSLPFLSTRVTGGRASAVLYVAQETKTGRRPIPISDAVLEILNAQVRHLKSPFVFLDDDGDHYHNDRSRNMVSKAAKQAMVDAGIADASFHTLRHTAAAWMVQDGVPLYEVQSVLGHSTPVMTQRYAHLQPEHLRRAVNVLDKKLRVGGARSVAEKGQK